MPQIKRTFPGKSAGEIYEKVDEMMERIAQKLALDYKRDGEVTIDLAFPMLVPGAMRQKVQSDIERKLDQLFA